MARERYPGERRGLSLFLEDLRPAAAKVCGPDSLLVHAIRRALHSGDLDHLRHARTLFNHLPREQRQRTVRRLRRPRPSRPARRRTSCSSATAAASQRRSSSFERPGEPAPDADDRGLADPRAAAGQRRAGHGQPGHAAQPPPPAICAGSPDMIESDRRLLSARYWRGRRDLADAAPTAQTPNSSS